MARVDGKHKYQPYRHDSGLKKPVEDLLEASGVDLINGWAFKNFGSFKSIFRNTTLLCLMV